MFDYAQRLQLALKDTARRSAMKVVAGLVLAIAAGFLIAALWSFLAHDLDWGPALASLGVAVLFILIGVLFIVPLIGTQLGYNLSVLPWLLGPPVEYVIRLLGFVTGHG